MSTQFQIALLRGVIGGCVTAGSTFFITLATGHAVRDAGIAAGVSFFGYLLARGVGEGAIDTQAAKVTTP
jgi:hypothetical protein